METVRKISTYEKGVLALVVLSVVLAYLCHTFWFSFDTLTVILFIPIFLGVRYVLNHFSFFQVQKGKLILLCMAAVGFFAWNWYWYDSASQYFHLPNGEQPPRLSSLLSGFTSMEVYHQANDDNKTTSEWIIENSKDSSEMSNIRGEVIDDDLDSIEERLNALDGLGHRNRLKEREKRQKEQLAQEAKEAKLKKEEEERAFIMTPPDTWTPEQRKKAAELGIHI